MVKVTRRSVLGALAAIPAIGIFASLKRALEQSVPPSSAKQWFTRTVVNENQVAWMLSQGWMIVNRNKDGDWVIERYNGHFRVRT